MGLELCLDCDEPTGRAGRSDDSMYTPDGVGPFCEDCFCDGVAMDTRESHITELKAQLADQIRLTDQKHDDCNSSLKLAIKLCKQREDMERKLKAESARVAELEASNP